MAAFLPKVKIGPRTVDDTFPIAWIEIISTAANTGKIGDGKILTKIEQTVRIRTAQSESTPMSVDFNY